MTIYTPEDADSPEIKPEDDFRLVKQFVLEQIEALFGLSDDLADEACDEILDAAYDWFYHINGLALVANPDVDFWQIFADTMGRYAKSE